MPRSPISSIVTSANKSARPPLKGIAAAPGQAFAPAWRWKEARLESPGAGPTGQAGADELERAIEQVKARLAVTTTRLHGVGASAEAGILEAQALMLEDPALLDGARELVMQGTAADAAVAETMAPFAAMLRASPDPVFQARAADVDDVVGQVRRALLGLSDAPPMPTRPSIVVARDLAPSQTAGLDRALVVGFATEQGTATAHTAILARALGLPAVVGIPGLVDAVVDGQPLLLDGDEGTLLVDPPADAIPRLGGPAALAVDAEPALTRDGRRVEVGSNAANLEDALRAAAAGADGIGLLRSEFLFLGADQLPTEDEQVAMLEAVTAAMGSRPVILRTLDVGADKPLPALPQPPEANPALGVRGLRLQLLRRPDLLADQLRAALRVAAKHPLRLMFPMVSTLDEVRQAKAILAEAARDVNAATVNGPRMPVGIMVEVPAAAIGADLLAREVDFFSIGTNDLTQYLFAADRTNPDLGPLADSLHPAVLRMIDQVVKAAHRHRRWVGVCGEMASDLWAVPVLVGLGVDELSVHPPMVARIKAAVRQLNAAECAKVAAAALKLEGGAAVRHLLEQRHLEPSSLRPRTGR
ncbi:MAG: multiphosphoryl transfer protein [Chloroflexota bacterium]|nr:multiphosphoryl transfer protein [Chloroflexota bacterium]MEA2668486.1 multiphosphoryl transfer protein [Chloroflexota bacterium]